MTAFNCSTPTTGRARFIALMAAALFCTTAAPLQAAETQISVEAAAQLRALIEEKQQRSVAEKKISSELLYAIKRRNGDALFDRLPQLRAGLNLSRQTTVSVEIRHRDVDKLNAVLHAIGGSLRWHALGHEWALADAPLTALTTLAEDPSVLAIRTAQPAIPQAQMFSAEVTAAPTAGAGQPIVTEGDVAHTFDQVRQLFNVDGSGVIVCAISDSVDELQALQNLGELPLNVTVLPGQSGIPGRSEGTALLEIIHDIAPGATLMFATAGDTPSQTAQNILALAAAGCQVIVDDVFFITEPLYQPGVIEQAIKTVTDSGVHYVVASGNFFNLDSGFTGVYEGLFQGTALTGPLAGLQGSAHAFNGQNFITILTDAAIARNAITLKWANAAGQSADDYDVYLLSPGMTTVFDASTNVQDGDDDSLEILLNDINRTGSHLVVVKFSGADRTFQINSNGGLLQGGTDGQIFGHNDAATAISVGAVDVNSAAGAPFTGGAANPPEPFTSDGYRRVFFDANGTPLGANGVLLRKPDLVAADRVSTGSSNFLTFFGASASAPHVAGFIALYLHKFGPTPVARLQRVLRGSALDVGAPGHDRAAGAGLIMGLAAFDLIHGSDFEQE